MDMYCRGLDDSELYSAKLQKLLTVYSDNSVLQGLQLESKYFGVMLVQNIAGIFSMVVGFTMLLHHNFKRHPYRLYAWEVLAYSGMCFTPRLLLLSHP